MRLIGYLSVILLLACQNQQTQNSQAVKTQVKEEIATEGNTKLFYFYKPDKTRQNSSYIIAIDPHGNGKSACLKFKEIAGQIGAISIGLNNVENNVPEYQNKIKKAIQEVKQKFNTHNNPVLIAGFSGGARMAYSYAMQNNINAVIMCGAGVGNQIPVASAFRMACISGYKDFNFIEQYYSPYSNILEKKNYIALHFDGIHEWPPEKLLQQASNFVLNEGNSESYIGTSPIIQSREFLVSSKYMDAFKILELNYKTCSPEQVGEYKVAIGQLLQNDIFKEYIGHFENILMDEQSRNRAYMQSLIQKDFIWWKAEKQTIEKKMNDADNELLANSYYRTKAFLGVLLFSKTNSSVRSKQLNEAKKYLKIYSLFEPENPDVYYLQALYELNTGKKKNIVDNLKKAIGLGFSDYKKMRNDFPEEIVKEILH
ncbi:MAG: hypothetical protein GXO79_16155 [Chlorobi bacterium]|nr:hypothetical protein [Chlorobiota bacterium]